MALRGIYKNPGIVDNPVDTTSILTSILINTINELPEIETFFSKDLCYPNQLLLVSQEFF